MSVYTRNAVYNYVYDKVIQAYPNVYISGMYEPVVPSFPAVFIREIGNFSNNENVTFSGSQDVWTSTFEVQIQSNKTDTPMSEVYEIFDVVKEAFSSLFYIRQTINGGYFIWYADTVTKDFLINPKQFALIALRNGSLWMN